MNIMNTIFIPIFLAAAIVQTYGQDVQRLGAFPKFGRNDRALPEVGGDDDAFSMMPVATDAAAGASGDMSVALVVTEDAARASVGKRAMIKHGSTSTSFEGSTKSSKGSKGSKGSKECPEPELTCTLEMIFEMFLAIRQHTVQMEVDDNEIMIVWTEPTNETITIEFPGDCVCNGKALAVGGGGAGGRDGGGGGAGGVVEYSLTDFSSAFNVTFQVGRGGVGQDRKEGEDGQSTTATLLSQSLKAGGGGGGGGGFGGRLAGEDGQNGTDPINLGGGGSGGGGQREYTGGEGGYPGGNGGADGSGTSARRSR